MIGDTIQKPQKTTRATGAWRKRRHAPEKLAFALGGLGGNNAHGAGFLQAALVKGVQPRMISCTSGQIYWTFQYLRCLNGRHEPGGEALELRSLLETEIDKMGFLRPWLHNPDLDLGQLLFFGRDGIFKPAGPLYFADAWMNAATSLARISMEASQTFVVRRLLEIFPNRVLLPDFPNSFYEEISQEFRSSEIGIVFNSYDPVNGHEYVYLNDAARELLQGTSSHPGRYGHCQPSSYRDRTTYQDITPGAVRRGLWLYWYGVGDKRDPQLDGAYYREIMLSELTAARVILVVRPLHFHWSGDLPRNWPEMEDLKTKVGFNGAYAGERYQIELINKLLDKHLKNDAKYHKIELLELEMDRNRGFFGYLFEDLAVFDDAFQKGTDLLELLCAKEPGLCAGRAISVVPE